MNKYYIVASKFEIKQIEAQLKVYTGFITYLFKTKTYINSKT